MARTAVIALSRHGAALAVRLSEGLQPEPELLLERRFAESLADKQGLSSHTFDLPLAPVLRRAWNDFDAIVLFLPVGAAVRLAAPLLKDKRSDPAVVCVDDAGRFSVSLISGHLGGADELALKVAGVLGAEAVVTSGSHATQTLAVDLLGSEFGWKIEAEPAAITRASAAVVNRDSVGVFQSVGEETWWPVDTPLPDNITCFSSREDLLESRPSAALIISDEHDPFRTCGTCLAEVRKDMHVVLYRPPTLVAGMGCRRDVPAWELENLLSRTLEENNLSVSSLAGIATADLKQDEEGLIELSQKLGVPVTCFGAEELNALYDAGAEESEDKQSSARTGSSGGANAVIEFTSGPGLHPSDNARRLIGVWGVAEPAALLASGARRLLVPKQKAARATVAVARIENR